MCIVYTGGKDVHYIHLNKVSKYCFVEVGCINKLFKYSVYEKTDSVH